MTAVRGAPVPMDVLTDPEQLVEAWTRYLERTGLSQNTKRTYAGEVRQFLLWLLDEQTQHRHDEVFTDPDTRTFAVRDYRRWLLTERKRAPKGVDAAMTAISNVYVWTGLGAPTVPAASGRRQTAPKALTTDQTRAVFRQAEKRGPRDLALVVLAVNTGLRVSEIAALDSDDVWMSARQGQVQVRAGKGDRPRTVPLNEQARDVLSRYLKVRPAGPGPLFLTRTGNRMADRSIRHTVGLIGQAAGVDVSPHVLRHTFGTSLVRRGEDMATVADLMGHASMETTRIYARPSADHAARAVGAAAVDF